MTGIKYLTHKLFILKTVCVAMIFARSSIYPSIYWNPWNPLFACKDPTINVRIGDTINFLCPSDEYNFYIPSSHVNPIYENLYFLNNDIERFKSCNATGTRRLLRCDDKQSTAKLYTISFRDIQTSETSMKFVRGKTYYLIGTGFRETSKLDNKVNGSCRDSGSAGQFRLRLKIHICEKDDKCNICESNACYYQKCGVNCTKWENFQSPTSEECNEIETRTCRYPYLDHIARVEYRPKPYFNKSDCDENITNTGPNKGLPLIECNTEEYKIALYIVIFIVLVLIVYLVLRSDYVAIIANKVSTCLLIGGSGKNVEETDKLSNEEMQISRGGDMRRPTTEVIDLFPETQENTYEPADTRKSEIMADFFKEIQRHTNDDIERCKVQNILDLLKESQLDRHAETERRKNELIINFFRDTLIQAESKTKLIIDLFTEQANIDDVDRGRIGSRNMGFRSSGLSMPKKVSLQMT